MIVYTLEQRWEVGQRSTYRRCRFWKKYHLFRWSSFWSWRLYKQAKLSYLGHRKPACIYWKVGAPKTSYCLVRILVQSHNWAIFFRKWARRSRYSYRAMLKEFLFTQIVEKDIGNIWFQQDGAKCHTEDAALYVLRPVFKDRIISRRADVVWPPRSWDLTPLEYYIWGAVKDKCYANKPETIDDLKDNIREAIGEIQMHTIDNVLSRGSHLNEMTFHY